MLILFCVPLLVSQIRGTDLSVSSRTHEPYVYHSWRLRSRCESCTVTSLPHTTYGIREGVFLCELGLWQ